MDRLSPRPTYGTSQPKAYVFTLAVFPQFLSRQFGPIWIQAVLMGAIILFTQMFVYGGTALAAGWSRDALVNRPTITTWIGRVIGAFFVIVAFVTAMHSLSVK